MSLLKRIFGSAEETPQPSPAAAEPLLVNAYATVRDLPTLDFPHTLRGRRDLSNPELASHLEGFIGYVMSRGDGQMTATRYHLWRHLQRVRHHVNVDVMEHDLPALEAWASAANAVIFLPDGNVRAADMAVLLSAEGESDPAAALPYQADAVARRRKTLASLDGIQPPPPVSMPPAIGEAELMLRSSSEVARRALALFYVAAHGQARSSGMTPIAAGQRDRNPVRFAAITPQEQAFLDGDSDDIDAASAMTWRYEAANTLFWALGVDTASIATSDEMIDVDALWLSVATLAQDGKAGEALRLRPAAEIIDALDRTWLEHWIVRQARAKEIPLTRLNGDVVMERHIALNWLTNFQNDFGIAWDDTDTPT